MKFPYPSKVSLVINIQKAQRTDERMNKRIYPQFRSLGQNYTHYMRDWDF